MKHVILIFLMLIFSFYISDSFAQLLPGDVNSQSEWTALETCTVGKYGNYLSLGSWSIDVVENKSGVCKLHYSYEVEMGYHNYDCQIPTNYLETTDWNSDYPPISPDLFEQYCTLVKSGNPYYDLAIYWYLIVFTFFASITGIGVLAFFLIRKLRKRRKNHKVK